MDYNLFLQKLHQEPARYFKLVEDTTSFKNLLVHIVLTFYGRPLARPQLKQDEQQDVFTHCVFALTSALAQKNGIT